MADSGGPAKREGTATPPGAAAGADLREVLVSSSAQAPYLEEGPAADERASLLGKTWRSSEGEPCPQPRGPQPPAASGTGRLFPSLTGPASGAKSTSAATASGGRGTGATRGTPAPASAFEVSAAAGSPFAAGAFNLPRQISTKGTGRVQAERQPSTLLTAATAAGDLHTAVPAPPTQQPQQQPGSQQQQQQQQQYHQTYSVYNAPPGQSMAPDSSVRRGAAGGPGATAGGGGGGGDKGSAGRGFSSDMDLDASGNLADYLRDAAREEQLRQSAEAAGSLRGCCCGLLSLLLTSRAALKRALAAVVCVGGLAAAIYLSLTPQGQREVWELPVWRWFLVVGCLPIVWYLPWITVFLIVLALESMLPVAVPGRSARSPMAAAAGAGGGNKPGGWDGERGASAGGPAMMIYHILGVRRHVVRVLRSVCAQLLIHYAVADHIEPEAKPYETAVMKTWACLTLLLTANMLKSLVAKALSKHFHSKGYLERMQKAVQQELVLMALSRPCPGRRDAEGLTHMSLGYHLASIFGYGGKSGSPRAGGTPKANSGGGAQRKSPFAMDASTENGGSGGGGMGRHAASSSALRDVQSTPQSGGLAAAAAEAQAILAASPAFGGGDCGSRPNLQRHARSSGDMRALDPQHGTYGASAAQHGSGAAQHSSGAAQHGGMGRRSSLAAASSAGSGDISVGRGRGGGGASRQSRQRKPPAPRGWRAFWTWLREHVSSAYRKTRMQWDLSRPSARTPNASTHHRSPMEAGGGAGGAGGLRGGAAGGPGGGGGDVGGMDYDQLRTSLFWLEQHIRRNKLRSGVTLTDQLRAAAEGGEEAEVVSSKTEAKRLAFYIHLNVLGLADLKGRKYLVAKDFEPFFSTPEEVREAFNVFDSDGDGRITLQNMCDTIVRIYKERKKLALTLQDTRTVVAKLELIVGVALHVLCAFFYLVIWQVNVRELWLSISSITLAFVFVFGNSVRSIYEAVLFLFVVHPFDVGDWLLLASGDMVKVEEIALLFCTFLKGDGRRLYYPNTKLMGEPIVNVSRSESFYDSIVLLVDMGLPGSALEAVEARFKRWLAENPKQFTGSGGVMARALANPSKLQLTAVWEYCHTGEDGGRTARWRSKALFVLSSAIEACGAAYTLPAIRGVRGSAEAAAAVGVLAAEGGAHGGGMGSGKVGLEVTSGALELSGM
ncbi:hypothetical protein HYH03_001647 [Edaphochlamys debaryana]|uniref:EF-hand domain-containing protein n=1 Tax=Edaphochlamys debaryana TaxID=47281 RepID=A0A835YFP8_9CHLO|nr:hypothetical protein HYH03_001647 [Edaphochlamys debaryana]|eukprot:KAG2500887.1 hypothetical protein HYH03_001647 [Edaphochlamys debaryana]